MFQQQPPPQQQQPQLPSQPEQLEQIPKPDNVNMNFDDIDFDEVIFGDTDIDFTTTSIYWYFF